MESFTDNTFSAYFHGLVDVCLDDDGQLVYLVSKGGALVIEREHITETECYSIPERKHFPFTLPRASEVMNYYEREDPTLYEDILSYLKRFSGLDDEQRAILANYIFLTYLHDHPKIDHCPLIFFEAVPERGKSRTGKSIIYAAFRGIHLIELREPIIFRYSRELHGTIFFDLMDISKKAERANCVDILLGRYEKGAQCARVLRPDLGPFKDIENFVVYGPTIGASNVPANSILETRCLPINMPNRPGNYENPRPEKAMILKERLTAWRAKHLTEQLPHLEPIPGISGRLWDITKPLFLVNKILGDINHQTLEDAILRIAGEKGESKKESLEGRLIAIIKEITEENDFKRLGEWSIMVSDIRIRFNQDRPENKQVSPQWIGKRLKSMSFRNRIIHGYSEIQLTYDEYVMMLEQYGHEGRESKKPDNSLYEDAQRFQVIPNEVESGGEFDGATRDISFNDPGEREYYEELVQTLMEKEGMSQDEARRKALQAIKDQSRQEEITF